MLGGVLVGEVDFMCDVMVWFGDVMFVSFVLWFGWLFVCGMFVCVVDGVGYVLFFGLFGNLVVFVVMFYVIVCFVLLMLVGV